MREVNFRTACARAQTVDSIRLRVAALYAKAIKALKGFHAKLVKLKQALTYTARLTWRLWFGTRRYQTVKREGAHEDSVWGVVWTQDDKLISGSIDETVKVWKANEAAKV